MNNGEPLSGEWLTSWEHVRLIEEAKEQERFSEFYIQIPEFVIRHKTQESHLPLMFISSAEVRKKRNNDAITQMVRGD